MLKLSFVVCVSLILGLITKSYASPTVSIIEPAEDLVPSASTKNPEGSETLKAENTFGLGYYPVMAPMFDEFYGLGRPTYAYNDGFRYGSYSQYSSRYNGYKSYSTYNTPFIYRRPIYAYWR